MALPLFLRKAQLCRTTFWMFIKEKTLSPKFHSFCIENLEFQYLLSVALFNLYKWI